MRGTASILVFTTDNDAYLQPTLFCSFPLSLSFLLIYLERWLLRFNNQKRALFYKKVLNTCTDMEHTSKKERITSLKNPMCYVSWINVVTKWRKTHQCPSNRLPLTSYHACFYYNAEHATQSGQIVAWHETEVQSIALDPTGMHTETAHWVPTSKWTLADFPTWEYDTSRAVSAHVLTERDTQELRNSSFITSSY